MSEPTTIHIAQPTMDIAALAWGQVDAPPQLAVHGWLDNAASFSRVAPLLANTRRVIALDLPGHGHSDHLPAGVDYHWSAYVGAVIASADALGLERFSLLGHSLGAGVCSLVAAAIPERVDQLWLIEGLGLLDDDGSRTLERFGQGVRAALLPLKPLRRFADIDNAVSARTLASGLPAGQGRPIIERALIETDGGWQWRSDPRLTRPTALRMARSQVHALLAGIEAPTALLLSDPATAYLPTATMDERIACVRDIRVQRMAGGHHLQLEHPATTAAWFEACTRAIEKP